MEVVFFRLDQIAFACASNFQNYCVTASVDTVDFETNRSRRTSHHEASVNYVQFDDYRYPCRI
jgi:hypothetical protein